MIPARIAGPHDLATSLNGLVARTRDAAFGARSGAEVLLLIADYCEEAACQARLLEEPDIASAWGGAADTLRFLAEPAPDQRRDKLALLEACDTIATELGRRMGAGEEVRAEERAVPAALNRLACTTKQRFSYSAGEVLEALTRRRVDAQAARAVAAFLRRPDLGADGQSLADDLTWCADRLP